MKPLSLEIAGLNSFRRKQVIEFGALLEDGLFGIFGPTGSGKSSILDAITLALYGRVKRAQGGKSGIINVLEKTCSVRFMFEIDADGERRTYSIERVLGRASGRADGVVTRRARLIEHDGEREVPIAEKQGEIDGQILQLLGIEYDEFMRAVVLPQGAFADFLGLKPKERAGVLQRLFGLQELGIRLSSRLKAQAELMRTTRAGIEGRLAELRACDDDAVSAAGQRSDEAAASEERARLARADAATALESAERLRALLDERDALRARDEDRGRVEQEIAVERSRLERSERATTIAAFVDALERAAGRCAESEAAHAAAVIALAEATTRAGDAGERFAVADAVHHTQYDRLCDEIARCETAERELEELAKLAADVEELERERRTLGGELETTVTRRAELRATIEASTATIVANETRLNGLAVSREEHDLLSGLQIVTERLRERQRQHAERERAIASFDAQLATVAAAIAETTANQEAAVEAERSATAELVASREDLERHREARSAIEATFLQVRNVLRMVEQLEEQCRMHERQCSQTRASIEQRQADWKVFEHRFHGISERRQNLEVERLDAQERLQLAYRRSAVATLAPQLKDGAPCPLCGSLEHPQHAHAGMMGDDAELAECESKLRAVESELKEATERFTRCGQEWGEIQTAIRLDAEQLERSEQALATMRVSIVETLAAAGEELPLASAADVKEYLETVRLRGIDERGKLDRVEARAAELDALIPQLASRAAEQSRRIVELQTQHRGLGEQRREALDAATILASEISALRAEIATQSGGRTPEEIERDLEQMRENDRTAQHLREVIGNEQKKIAGVRIEIDELDRTFNEQSNRHSVIRSNLERLASESSTRRSAIEQRLDAIRAEDEKELPIARLIADRRERRDRLARERSEAEAAHAGAMSDERLAQQALEHHLAAHRRDEQDRERCEQECRRALAAAGFESAEEARDARLDEAAQLELRRSIATTEEELRSLAVRLTEIDRQVAGRELTDDELSVARDAAAEATRALEAAIGAAAAARTELERLRERNVEYHRFSDENAGALERERTIEQLGRYLQGDAFINFLADERLAEVCRRATRTLEELTGGRYEILSRPDEGFLVRDMGNGGVERAPGSLSGGETFVVSLSLALALSDTIQMGRAPLEFFFLDEGFGTLDAELLETVVDTLERLRSRRRTIGLITHVTTLRERVPRRLVVSPPVDGAGSLVRFEVA